MGRDAEAEQVRTGVLAAAELYALERDGTVAPVPLANHVQAWTVGALWALRNRWDGRG